MIVDLELPSKPGHLEDEGRRDFFQLDVGGEKGLFKELLDGGRMETGIVPLDEELVQMSSLVGRRQLQKRRRFQRLTQQGIQQLLGICKWAASIYPWVKLWLLVRNSAARRQSIARPSCDEYRISSNFSGLKISFAILLCIENSNL